MVARQIKIGSSGRSCLNQEMRKACLALLLALAPVAAGANSPGLPRELSLGDGLKVQMGQEHGTNVLYLPGKEEPIVFGKDVFATGAVLSPDRLRVAVVLFRSSGSGANYFAILICRRSDLTASATWEARYVLFAVELDLKFGLRTHFEDIHSLSNEGIATIKFSQAERREPPAKILRYWEEWDLAKEERVQRIREAGVFEKFEE